MTTPTNAFVGYIRCDRGRWRAVCAASTQTECYRLVLAIPVTALRVERCVLPAGKRPTGNKREK